MRVPEPPRTEDEKERADFRGLLVKYLRSMKVSKLNMTVSNPPTQAEVQAIADKLDELIGKIDS